MRLLGNGGCFVSVVQNGWKIAASRALVVLAILIGVLATLVVAATVAVQSGWAERRIESLAAGRLGREVDIEGMRVLAAWPPQIEVAVLRVANPDWASEPYLVDARGVRGTLEVGPLLRGRIIGTAAVDEAAAALERDGERTTWSFPREEQDEPKPRRRRTKPVRASLGLDRRSARRLPRQT